MTNNLTKADVPELYVESNLEAATFPPKLMEFLKRAEELYAAGEGIDVKVLCVHARPARYMNGKLMTVEAYTDWDTNEPVNGILVEDLSFGIKGCADGRNADQIWQLDVIVEGTQITVYKRNI